MLRSNAAFVEIGRGRWQLGRRVALEPLRLPYDEQQAWMRRALDHLMKAAVVRAATKGEAAQPGTA